MSSLEADDHNSRRKRGNKTTHKETKRKKSKSSPRVDAVKGVDKETIKFKIERDLLEELQLTSVSTFPKPLSEYVEDHSKLLEEVFTVLSRDDIEGMLPDILKGLRMKRIKELCAGQLAKLDSDAIARILSGHEESVTLSAVQQVTTHRTPVAPPDDSQTGSTPCCSRLHKAEFSDVSDQEQLSEKASAELEAVAMSDRVGSSREMLSCVAVREEGDMGEGNDCLESTSQWTVEGPACGGGYDVRSNEDDLDINTAIEDTIDMELAGELPKTHNSRSSQKQAPPASKARQPAQDMQQPKKKKRKAESHSHTHLTSSSELVHRPTLENRLRKKLLSRVQREGACRTSKEAGTLTSSLPTPAAKSIVTSTDSHDLELQMKEKALKALLTKSLRKPS